MTTLQQANPALSSRGRLSPMTMPTTARPATTPTMRRSVLVQVASLRRLLNRWVAAAIACRETALLAQRQLDDREFYRGPIDDALEYLARRRLEKA